MIEPTPLDAERPEMPICEWCGGEFLPEDMDGEHCRECADEIFRQELPE